MQALANAMPYKVLTTHSLLSVGRAGLHLGLHAYREIDVLNCVEDVFTLLPKRPKGRGLASLWHLVLQDPF